MFGHIQQADTSIESKRLPEAMFTTNTRSRSQDGKIGAPQQEQTALNSADSGSSYGQSAVTNRIGCAAQLDFDVVSQAVQAFHQLTFRQVGEIAAHQSGYLRLRNTHPATGLLLGQAQTANGAGNFDDQAGLYFELLCIGQA